jgi:superfamily II DNA or RNA helicase
MLGLSATMNRKDGLSKVFKMFLGDVVYKEKRDTDDNVLVKTIHYKNSDDDFSNVVYNFKGQTHYAVMIRKLCEFNPRSEFILQVLKDILEENDKHQVMILAHNKSLLNYLHDAIKSREIAEGSVGYYVGGMKEAALKQSEKKKVVIATYAMAEEALDIKTLSCLIMATPKTDVTQAVGRILRVKHAFQPIVVDIVDQHEIFQRQYYKRRSFYAKCKYTIKQTDSYNYLKDKSVWETVFDPSKYVFGSKTSTKTSANNKTNNKTNTKTNTKSTKQIKQIKSVSNKNAKINEIMMMNKVHCENNEDDRDNEDEDNEDNNSNKKDVKFVSCIDEVLEIIDPKPKDKLLQGKCFLKWD